MPGRNLFPCLLILLVLLPGPGRADDDAGLSGYLAANGLLQRGLYDLAAGEYQAFLAEHPRHEKAARARYGLAVCHFRTGAHAAALEALAPLIDQDDFAFAAEVGALRAQAELATGNHERALAACAAFLRKHARHKLAENVTAILVETCLLADRHDDVIEVADRFTRRWKQSPLRERVWFFAGSAQLAREDFAAAAAAFEQLLGGFPQSPYRPQALLFSGHCAERQGDAGLAQRRYEELLQVDRCPEQAEALFALASLARDKDDRAAALARIARLLEVFPEHPRSDEARLLRAAVLLGQDEVDAARRDLAAVTSEGLADRVAYWRAKAALRAGDAAAAAAQFQQALREHPESELRVEMQYDRCVALLAARDNATARQALSAFCREHGDHPLAADALLSLVNLTQAAGDLEQADELGDQFLQRYGDHPEAALAALLQADNAYQQGAFEDALRGYSRFLKRFADSALRPQAELRLGLTLYRLERFDDARPVLQRSVQHEPVAPAVLALAEIDYAAENWSAAADRFRAYLTLAQQGAARGTALLKLGLCRQRAGDPAAALASYDELLQEAPDDPAAEQARFERGQVLVALGRTEQADAAFQQALQDDGDPRLRGFARRHLAQLAAARGDHAEVIRLAGELLKEGTPALQAEAHLLAGQAHLLGSDPAAAERHLRAYLKLADGQQAPADQRAAAELQLAQALSRQGQVEEARSLLKRWQRTAVGAVDTATRAAGLYELGWTSRRLGDGEAAVAAFESLLALDPEADLRARALVELAELRSSAGDCGAVTELLAPVEQLETADTVRAAAAYRLGVCAFEGEDYEAAARRLSRFVERFPSHPLEPSVRYFCGEALVRLGQHKAAMPHFRRIVGDFDKHEVFGPSLVRLGDCLVVLQQWAAAGEQFARYRQALPDGPLWHEAQFGIGWTAENQGRYEPALKAYRELVARHKGPTAARAQFQIGECLFAQEKYEDAVRELLRVEILYAYPEWSAAALYEAGRCFEKLGRAVEARQQFQACAERYETTRWAELARGRLAAVEEALLPGRSGS